MLGNCKCYVCGNVIPLSQPVYTYDDSEGNEHSYHMLCFKENTVQGVQGYIPKKVYQPIGEEDGFGF